MTLKRTARTTKKRQPPVTLAPLSFDQALGGLLAVKPRPAKKAAGNKKG